MPDTQRTVEETAAIGGFVHALVKHLAVRHDAGERLPVAEAWRNRWSACRHGLEGELLDLVSGERRGTRERVAALDELGATMPAGDGPRASGRSRPSAACAGSSHGWQTVSLG